MIKHCAAARAILSLPLDARRKALSRQQRYDAFRRRFGHVVPRPLPEAIRYCQFAYLDADWTPRLLGERGAPLPDGKDERAEALRRLAHESDCATSASQVARQPAGVQPGQPAPPSRAMISGLVRFRRPGSVPPQIREFPANRAAASSRTW